MGEWISVRDEKPTEEGKYLTFGSYGVGTSWWSHGPFRSMFQDCDTNNDEGMEDWDGNVFYVTHWMELPEKPLNP